MWRATGWPVCWFLWGGCALALPPTPVPRTPTATPVIRPTWTPVRVPTTPPVWNPPPTATQTGPVLPTAIVPANALWKVTLLASVDGGVSYHHIATYEGLTGPMECYLRADSPCMVRLIALTPTPTPTPTVTTTTTPTPTRRPG